jgi:hypothetical protein
MPQHTHEDCIHATGTYEILVTRHGKTWVHERGHNIVVNGGRDLVLTQTFGVTSTPIAYMALGSGATTPAATDTALTTEEPGPNGVRKAITKTLQSPGTMLCSATWDESENQNTTVNEVGLFTTSGVGTGLMLSHFKLQAPLPKDQFTSLQINYSIQLTAS